MFICYLSYLLLSILKMKLEKIKLSPEEAIEELGSMYNVYFYDKKRRNKFIKTVSLTKIQEKILKAIGGGLIKKLN